MLYGAKMFDTSKEIKKVESIKDPLNNGGELFKKFQKEYEGIMKKIRERQFNPIPNLDYSYDTLWNFSWGIADYFD